MHNVTLNYNTLHSVARDCGNQLNSSQLIFCSMFYRSSIFVPRVLKLRTISLGVVMLSVIKVGIVILSDYGLFRLQLIVWLTLCSI
jgi:hypothetical protein